METEESDPKSWELFSKSRPSHQKLLKSSPKQAVAAKSSNIYRNVTVHKNKRKRTRYAEIIEEKILERKPKNAY